VTSARRIAKNTGVQAAGDVASKVLSAAFYVVMARELGKAGFGDFVFAASVVFFGEMAEFGLGFLLTREVGRNPENTHRLFWSALVLTLALGVVGLALAFGIAVVGGYGTSVLLAVLILALAKLVELAGRIAAATLRGFEEMGPIAVSLILQRLSTAVVGIAAMLAGAGLLEVSAIYLGGAVVGLGYIGWALVQRAVRPRLQLSLGLVREVFLKAVPFGLSALSGTALARIDAVLLSLMKGNVAVGLYGSAYRVFESTLFFSWAFGFATLPALSRLSDRDPERLRYAYETTCKVVTVVLFPVGLAFVLFSSPITKLLYGHPYADAASALSWLGAAVALYGLFWVSFNVLAARGRQRVVAWTSAAVLVQNIVLNLVLIPAYSFNGAAAAMTISQATLTVTLMGFAIRATGPISLPRVLAGPSLGCLAMAVAWLIDDGLVGLVAAGIAYLLVLSLAERRLWPGDTGRLLRAVLRRAPAPDGATAQR
jgi:O-antigen/teichoic acid export membrane protein